VISPRQLYLAGLSAYIRGERRAVAQYCERALECTPSDVLTVRIIHLHLLATELWWSLMPTPDIGNLIGRSRAAATRAADPASQALAHGLHGRYLIAVGGLPEAVAEFATAAELAKISGNLTIEVQALSDLGHHTVGRNLSEGIAILNEALARSSDAEADAFADARPCDRHLLSIYRARLAGLIGVAILDQGVFDDAETWLRQSVSELRTSRAWDLFASISNYLGQLLTQTGRFEEAEDTLRGALEPLRPGADLSTFQGYNLGLLGKLYLEWDRLPEAEEYVTAGWNRLQRTRHQAILPILRNYMGELLMHPAYSGRDVSQARVLFDETIAECQRSGFQRSEINALALQARAHLYLGDTASADLASAHAVTRLAAAGTMPALRSEEVYLARYQALNAIGAATNAEEWLGKARELLHRKAATIKSPNLRKQYLRRVPTNLEILVRTESKAPS
jgi:tetratricopeptide (TPR) repeat protein